MMNEDETIKELKLYQELVILHDKDKQLLSLVEELTQVVVLMMKHNEHLRLRVTELEKRERSQRWKEQ